MANDPTVPDHADQIKRLEDELLGVRRSMRARAVIEQAKGRLAERYGTDLEEAFRQLVRTSQQSNRRVAAVAAEIAGADPSAGDEELSGPWQQAMVPLRDGEAVIGAIDVAWSHGDARSAEHMAELADIVSDWVLGARIASRPADGASQAEAPVVLAAAVPFPAVVLRPERDWGGGIVDFSIEYANSAAVARLAQPLIGRRLLDIEPEFLTNGVFDAAVQAYLGSAGSGAAADRQCVRVGSRLVLIQSAEPGTAVLAAMELLGGFGWAQWSAHLDPLIWSPGLYPLIGRDPARGPVRLDRALAHVLPDDRQGVESLLKEAADGKQHLATDIRIQIGSDVRFLRVVAVAAPTGDGVLTLMQDITDIRRRDAETAHAFERLAAHRLVSAAERSQAFELRAALLPAGETCLHHQQWNVVARHAASSNLARFKGDFYETLRVGEDLVIIVGDVFGSGVPAADAMVRLRHASRALALADIAPAEIMKLLNRELCDDPDPPLASLLIARFTRPGTIAWAQAGHYSPIMLRDGHSRSLRRPDGHALGLGSETTYRETHTTMRPGDLVVVFTDGVLHGRKASGNPTATLAVDISAYAGDAAGLARRFTRPGDDEACLVAVEWPNAQ
jgi:hypothetical protein